MTPTPEDIARIAATIYPHIVGQYPLEEADAAAVDHAGRLLIQAARQAPTIRGRMVRASPTVDVPNTRPVETCGVCDGAGDIERASDPGGPYPCPQCDGSGLYQGMPF